MRIRFYFTYATRNENGIITSLGFSRFYADKEEMWANLEFQRLCGYEVRPFVDIEEI